MSRFLSERFSSLREYVPGEQPRDRKYIKLNTNESPYPPSDAVKAVAAEAAVGCNLYSDPTSLALRTKLSALYGVETENVIVTNGSDETLSFAFMGFCDSRIGAAFPDISYGFYRVFGRLYGLDCLEIPLRSDFSIDITDYFGLNRTIFIANPNAPTGIALSVAQIEKIIRRNPDNMVVIDEAYVDFGAESSIGLTKKYDNLLVIQTFSKSRSAAGARIGYGIAAKSVIADLEKLRNSTNPYNVNKLSSAVGCKILDENSTYVVNCKKIEASRKRLSEGLSKLGFYLTDSSANFVFAKHGQISGGELYGKLRESGILVRHFDAPRIADFNRITVGTDAEVDALIAACRKILEEKK